MAIVQMKKVSLVVLDDTRKESLKALKKAGVVHLEAVEGKGAVLQSFKEAQANADKAVSILEEIKVPKKQMPVQVKLSAKESQERSKEILTLTENKKSLLDRINQDTQELERLSLWGNVNPEDFVKLAEKNIFVYMYEIPEDKYASIGKEVKTILVNSNNKVSRFLVTSEEELTERPKALPPEAYSVPMPEKSTDQIAEEIRKAEQEISRIERKLLDAKKYYTAIKDSKKNLASEIEFETIYSGMGHESEDVDPAAENAAEESQADGSVKLAWLTGYVPIDSMEKFQAVCKENEWAYTASDPSDDDPVPTKLKNNKLVSLIYPLMDFLDVTPGYNEFDISAWFLLFFCIFFGMIFGDAGYGAIITVAALALMLKSVVSGKKVAPVMGLMLLLGMCTTVYGAFTCSWFGIDAEKLPEWMVNLSLAPISKPKVGEDMANTNQKIFCFMLALVQLSIAHITCFFRNKKTLKCLGDLGALFELWGMYYVVMSLVVDSVKYPLLAVTAETIYVGPVPLQFIALGTLGVGFVLNFIFSNYEGSIGKSILESLKNIISVLLGVVNVFSDIVSYIRLWAVALAGAAISSTVNSMAGPMFGKLALFVFGLVLVVFGHGLNNILNLLSVIVHGVRLNTLEFSQHLGMAWSGTKYKPFSDN